MFLSKSRKKILAGILLAIGILIGMVFLIDWEIVYKTLLEVDYRIILAASVVLMIGLALYSIRWRNLLGNRPGFINTFNAANIGLMINLFVPLRIGEPVRILLLSKKEQLGIAEVTTSVAVERWLENIMRVTALGGALVFGVGIEVNPLTISGAFGFILLALMFMVWMVSHREHVTRRWPVVLARFPGVKEERARIWIEEILTGLGGEHFVRRMSVGLLLSICTWSTFALYQYLILASIPTAWTGTESLAFTLAVLALAPPSATAAPGIYHAALILPFTLIGFNKDLVTSYAVLSHLVMMVWIVGFGLVGILQTELGQIKIQSPSEPSQL